jgi:hypothetical protein
MQRTRAGDDTDDPARHVALRVDRLEEVVARLLEHNYIPFQSDVSLAARAFNAAA